MLALAWLSRRPTLSASLIFVVVLHICFFPFIWGSQTLLLSARGVPSIMPNGAWYGGPQGPGIYRSNDPGGSAWQIEAYAPLIGNEFRRGNLPLWNPYQAFGMPLAANMHSQPFYPLLLPFALDPGPRTWNYFVLAHFLIAGLGAYLYLRLFLPFVPSLAGGIVSMLAGYYVLFFNMPHLSVEVLLPALFFATERLLRHQSVRHVLLTVLIVFLSIVGGMPESTLLVLAFGAAYFAFRVLSDGKIRAAFGRQTTHFVLANALGIACAAFLLVPFIEFLHFSFDTHQFKNIGQLPGLEHDRFGLSIFTYVAPLLFGTAWTPIAASLGGYEALRGFFGILPLLLIIIAAVSLSAKVPHRRLMAFFLGSAIILILKRYGAPVVNAIGYLPLFRLVLFPKYDEPLLAFAVASLCAFGLDQFLAGRLTRRRLNASLAAAFLLLVAMVAFSWPAVLAARADLRPYYASVAGAAAVLLISTWLFAGARTRWLPGLLLVVLVCEMAGDYIYPVYYLMTRSATAAANPYRGAPYIAFLESHTPDRERIFGRDFILFPNWAGAFQLLDIRGLDAVYYWKYLRFVRRFLGDEVPHGPRGDGVNRFTGHLEHTFDTPLKKRLLQLSSVRYLLSMRPFAVEAPMIQDILDQNLGHLAPGREHLIETRRFTIGGEAKPVLYEHPPYDRLPFATEVTPARQRFFFAIALDPAVYDGSHPICGDGVEFRLEARDSHGRIALLYSRYIDPKHHPAERRWIAESADLRPYMGQQIELLFTTTPGPAGDTCMDWAGWGDPHFSGDAPSQPAFQPVYDREIKIYEYADHLPRAALYSSVELAADDESALARLGSPALDIFRTAVVTANGLNPAELASITALNRLASDWVRTAKILSYTSQEVTVAAEAERPALLVLNDSDYPGWKVYIDGRPAAAISANYMFRGVMLPPGRHLVRFAYQPASFATGAAISGIALLCLAGFAVWRSRVAEPRLVH